MSIERTYYCEGPECETHGKSTAPPPYLPWGFLEVRETLPGQPEKVWHFCSWDCAMKYGATLPPMEVIPWDEFPEADGLA